MKLADNEMDSLFNLLNRAIRSQQIVIPTSITVDNDVQCTQPMYAIRFHPYIQVLDKEFLLKCKADHMSNGDESMGGLMLQFLNDYHNTMKSSK